MFKNYENDNSLLCIFLLNSTINQMYSKIFAFVTFKMVFFIFPNFSSEKVRLKQEQQQIKFALTGRRGEKRKVGHKDNDTIRTL